MKLERENTLEFVDGGDPWRENVDENFLHHMPGGMHRLDSVTPDLEPSKSIREFVADRGYFLSLPEEMIPSEDRGFVKQIKKGFEIDQEVDEFLEGYPQLAKAWDIFVRLPKDRKFAIGVGSELARPVYIHLRRSYSARELTYL